MGHLLARNRTVTRIIAHVENMLHSAVSESDLAGVSAHIGQTIRSRNGGRAQAFREVLNLLGNMEFSTEDEVGRPVRWQTEWSERLGKSYGPVAAELTADGSLACTYPDGDGHVTVTLSVVERL